ncbi:MAG TPA: ATP-binding cassette domain-containing protein [Candidatus Cloacimonadota bacterium]|nr:ATP-binding cassette domain-containing protein [Candidatus Cloacimonadota bacterium]HPS38716.1 ATP-binding cassette domain-containing protein [Candidatus Cloacimonadota bacterium]
MTLQPNILNSTASDKGWIIDSLRFGYPGKTQLFNGLSLDLDYHDLTLIRGENGCGKSTLLKLMTGELKPNSGTIALLEKRPDSADFSSRLFYFPQNPADGVIGITGRDDLKLWKLALNSPERLAQIDQIINDPLYEHIIDQPFTKLSTGQLRAMAMSILPCLIDRYWILDEPFAGLDSLGEQRLLELLSLKQLSGFPGAVIVSHNSDPGDDLHVRDIDLGMI